MMTQGILTVPERSMTVIEEDLLYPDPLRYLASNYEGPRPSTNDP